MKPKFEIGDRVIYKPCKTVGSVINMFRTTGIYAVAFDEERTSRHIHENELEFENPKLAFLTRLQELLATFDARIAAAGEGTDSATIDIYSGNDLIYFEDWDDDEFICKITAENIFKHDND